MDAVWGVRDEKGLGPTIFLDFEDDGYGPRCEGILHLFVLGLWSLSSWAWPLTHAGTYSVVGLGIGINLCASL